MTKIKILNGKNLGEINVYNRFLGAVFCEGVYSMKKMLRDGGV